MISVLDNMRSHAPKDRRVSESPYGSHSSGELQDDLQRARLCIDHTYMQD